MTSNLLQRIDDAIEQTNKGEYLPALSAFIEIYGTEDAPPLTTAKAASGLSYFGLCLALIEKKYKAAIELCKRAVALQFYNPDHWVNLTRVYAAAGHRRKALDAVETGLKQHPDYEPLVAIRHTLGVRARPPVPFLDRSHPINVTLGQARHAKKIAETEGRRRK